MRIAIIGGGFSGTMVAVHLLRGAAPDLELFLIERRDLLGRGVAYGTTDGCHLLNVPASKMSAYPDEADHFLKWLQSHGGGEQGDFAPRKLYGEYVGEQLISAAENTPGTFRRLAREAIDIRPGEEGVGVHLADGRLLNIDKAVLAIGNFPPGHPPAATGEFLASPRYVADPWSRGNIEGLHKDDAVLLIGTGLTAIDLALALDASGHEGPIYKLSRGGQLPAVHEPQPRPFTGFAQTQFPANTRKLVQAVRRAIEAAAENAIGWRAVIDSLRPITQQLWKSLDDEQKRHFVRHVRRYWDAHRHRMPPPVAAKVQSLRESGRLVTCGGRLLSLCDDADGVAVQWLPNGSSAPQAFNVARVINCTGPESDFRRMTHPLIVSLFSQGLVRTDPLRLGLDTSDDGALLDQHGNPCATLFTLGPLRKGNLWETTAVPEIRVQALELARTLLP